MAEVQCLRIGEVCSIEKGTTGLAQAVPGKYPLVATSAERKSSKDYQFDAKAICIPLVSSTGHGKKTLNYVHYQEGKFALGSILAALIPKDESALSARYLHAYLQKNKDRVLVPLMKGAANVSLSVTAISNIEIPLPSIKEQEEILEKIDSISKEHAAFLSEINIQSNLIDKLRQIVLQEAIEGKLTAEWRKQNPKLISGENHASKLLEKIQVEKDRLIKNGKMRKEKQLSSIVTDDKLLQFPNGWVRCRLGEVTELLMGQSPDGLSYNTVGEGVPLVNGPVEFGGMGPFERTLAIKFTTQPTKMCREGDLLLCVRGSTTGRTNIAGYDSCIGRGVAAIRPIFIERIFLNYLILSYRYNFYDLGTGSTFPNISQDKITNFKISLPSIIEQQIISQRVSRLMQNIDELENQVSKSNNQSEMLMRSVIKEAFERNIR